MHLGKKGINISHESPMNESIIEILEITEWTVPQLAKEINVPVIELCQAIKGVTSLPEASSVKLRNILTSRNEK